MNWLTSRRIGAATTRLTSRVQWPLCNSYTGEIARISFRQQASCAASLALSVCEDLFEDLCEDRGSEASVWAEDPSACKTISNGLRSSSRSSFDLAWRVHFVPFFSLLLKGSFLKDVLSPVEVLVEVLTLEVLSHTLTGA